MNLDLMAGVKSVTAERGWFRKVALTGAYTLIPVVGTFAYMGALLDKVALTAGGSEELPPRPGRFGEYLTHGFITMVPAFLMILIVLATFGIGFLLYIPFVVLYPALIAHYLMGDRTLGSLFQFKEAWERVKAHSDAYLGYWLVALLYGTVSSVLMFPVILVMELPMVLPGMMMPQDGSEVATGALVAWMGLVLALMVLMFLALYALQAFVSYAAYHYLGLYAREAYGPGPTTHGGTPGPPSPPLPPVAVP